MPPGCIAVPCPCAPLRVADRCRLETDEFFFHLATGSRSLQIIPVGRVFVGGCPISVLPPIGEFQPMIRGRITAAVCAEAWVRFRHSCTQM
jgi:hypothetical protein